MEVQDRKNEENSPSAPCWRNLVFKSFQIFSAFGGLAPFSSFRDRPSSTSREKKAINIFEIIFIAFQLLPLSFFLRPFPLLPPLPPSRVFLFSLLRPPNVLASAVQSYKCATYRKFNMGNMTWYGQRCEDSHAGKHLNRRERIRSFPRSWRTVTSSATFSHQSKREGRIPKIILILTPGFSSRC